MGNEEQGLGRIYCLSGCTAVGKTELALAWAEANGAEILNCDSLLFYRGMDIGTAKPSKPELARVPHHLIDIVDCGERMDIGRYVDLAIRTIREIQSRGNKVLVTGGSGFYLKAFFQPVVDAVEVSAATRAQVAELVSGGMDRGLAELQRRNPGGLEGLDTENPRRVARALERCIESGKTIAQLQKAFLAERNALVDAEKSLTILERDKEVLNARIARRVKQMVETGLVEEVKRLLAMGLEKNASAANAIGYREAIAHLKGELDLDSMIERITINTRRLAKKQRTWFRGQLPEGAYFVDLDLIGAPDILFC